ncbi:MAG TPA: hypothetical protein VJ904_07710 [Tichowtungia sp.]|nr:hypothetical protein [Tichowtungia sp.]
MAVKTDLDLSGCVVSESRVHFLNPAAPTEKSLNVTLQLGPDTGATGNGMSVLTVKKPVSGMLQIAFVELAYGVSPATKTVNRASLRPNQRKSCTTPVLASL